jgi:hypothetical protein
MAKKAKFKVGDKVTRRWIGGGPRKVVKIEAEISYKYLVEDKEGQRSWEIESYLSRSRTKPKAKAK